MSDRSAIGQAREQEKRKVDEREKLRVVCSSVAGGGVVGVRAEIV